MIKPYYQDEWTTLYLGDTREILPQLEVETIITDPVWPNTTVKELIGSDRPTELFAEICQAIPPSAQRLVVQELGCDSDPRFLYGVPSIWPYLRTCWLDYALPSYKGRILYTGDVAYAFGRPPAYIEGRHTLSGKCTSWKSDKLFERHSKGGLHKRMFTGKEDREYNIHHPSPRRLQHVEFLVHNFSDNQVVDPCNGSGTTAVAAKHQNRKYIGIDVVRSYLDLTIERLRQSVMALNC